jgi:hypothetical protein
MIKNGVLAGGLKFLSAPFGLGATPSTAADTSGQAVMVPNSAVSLPRFMPTLFAGFSMPAAPAFLDPKNPMNIPWAFFHQAMISLHLAPARPANPFADSRHDALSADAGEAGAEGSVSGGKADNSFFIRPVTYDKRYPQNSDPFSEIRFDGRF